MKDRLHAFFQLEAAGGLLLIAATVLAMICANTPLQGWYEQMLSIYGQIRLGSINIEKPLLLWINDGLMAVFFLGVGLEIKREFLKGHLAKASQVILPGVAALGGVVVPALIYVAFNHGNSLYLQGWAVPSATDIAFALGILALLGPRVPAALKSFVMILAVLDDLAAIIIIALFYTDDLSLQALAWAGFFTAVLVIFNRVGVRRTGLYLVVGAALWTTVLKSGVHATLAGVIVALAIPMDGKAGEDSPGESLMHALHPWINFGIVPVFAFANAGVTLLGVGLDSFFHPVTAGILLGLFVGKQAGILLCTWLLVRLGLAELPARGWREFHGAAVLCGIGFTMSLFISSLAFTQAGDGIELSDRLGILTGSLLSALVGWVLLRYSGAATTAAVPLPERAR